MPLKRMYKRFGITLCNERQCAFSRLGCTQQMHVCVVSLDIDTSAHTVMGAHTEVTRCVQMRPHVSIHL